MPKIKDLGIKVIPETMRPPEQGGGGCGNLTLQCINATHCLPTIQPCVGCTLQVSCLPTHQCGGCSLHFSCLPTHQCFGCTLIVSQCPLHSVWCNNPTVGGGGCGAISPVCGGSMTPTIQLTPTIQQGGITHEHVAALKEQLQQQIAALDEAAKSIGPQTSAEIDAREKQLNQELANLKERRKNIK